MENLEIGKELWGSAGYKLNNSKIKDKRQEYDKDKNRVPQRNEC